MSFWEGYIVGILSDMTAKAIEKTYEKYKNSRKVRNAEKRTHFFFKDRNVMTAVLLRMLKGVKHEILFATQFKPSLAPRLRLY